MIFFVAAIGIIPTAALMGRATEELAERSGPGIGGLLNVTFGNAPELIIALFALGEGLHEVVKASIIGSIIGNVMLVLGAAMFFGGLGAGTGRSSAGRPPARSRRMLFLAGGGVGDAGDLRARRGQRPALPSAEIVDYGSTVEHLSLAVGVVLILTYVGWPLLLAEDPP